MTMTKIVLATLLALAVVSQHGAATAQRPAPPDLSKLPKVQSIEVQFHTNDDDKDADTQLITDFRCGDSVFAILKMQAQDEVFNQTLFIKSYSDSFSDGATTTWVQIPIQSPVTKPAVHFCTTKVRIDPKGHDTWRFNYWVRLHYSDNTMDEYHYDGHALSEKVRENVFPLR